MQGDAITLSNLQSDKAESGSPDNSNGSSMAKVVGWSLRLVHCEAASKVHEEQSGDLQTVQGPPPSASRPC